MIFDSPEANQRISDTAAEAPPATFMERFQAADKQGQLRGTVLSPGFAVSEDYDRRIKDIKDAGLGDLSELNPMWNSKPTQRAPHVYSEGHSIYDMEPSKAVEDPHEAFQKKLEELAQKYPDKAHIIKADKPITGSESYQAAKKAAENAASIYGGPPLTGPIADFAGGMWSMRKDPFQIGTLVIGPMSPVRQGAKAVLTMGLKQAAANASVEAAMQPFVQSWRKSMNDSYGWWDAAEEIGMAGAFGLGADAGVRMLYRGVQARMGRKAILDEQGRVTGYESAVNAAEREALTARNLEIQKNLEALPKDTFDKIAQGDEEATIALAKALKADEDPSVAGAINALRNTDRVTLDGIDDGWRERSLLQQLRSLEDPSEPAPAHFDSAAKAERPRLADDAELPRGTEGNQHYRMLELDNKPVRFEAIDANRITTDPATFQFKGGRDAAGASNALRAVDFNGEYKGKVIVYEREDGSLVVADGHDRVSLANRAPEPQKLDALVFREVDGWTADQVRAEAARKNIQEGTGSLMDVAGAIRRHPEIVDDSMAVSTDFMADARSIARLSDDAFDAVAGGQVNPKHGVMVSDLVPDQARHMEVLRELDRRNPPTEAAARREIGNMLREPANMETLTRVMGIPLAEPHVIEARNDVLAGVLTTMRSDVETQAVAAVIRRLAEKPGLVSDTLAQAGRAVAEGQPIERAIDATLRRFEDVIGKAGVKGLADQPVRLSPTDDRPRFLAALAGSDAAVGRSMRADLDKLGYYSKALEAAKSLKQSKGTPEQMWRQIADAPGVRDNEIIATNLHKMLLGNDGASAFERFVTLRSAVDERRQEISKGMDKLVRAEGESNANWSARQAARKAEIDKQIGQPVTDLAETEAAVSAAARSNKTSITRDEIVKHLTDNRVGVNEKQYGYKQDGWIVDPLQWGSQGETKRFASQAEAEAYAQSIGLTREHAEQMHVKGKWQKYSLDPSNPTYRETVLHLPPSMSFEDWAAQQGRRVTPETERILRSAFDLQRDTGDFKSGHFVEPNIIGHMMTSLNKHEGKPVFTLDQIQSDWGQKLRDGGVRDEAKIAGLKARQKEARDAADSILSEYMDGLKPDDRAKNYRPDAEDRLRRLAREGDAKAAQWKDLDSNANLLAAEYRTANASSPGHPLVNTTDQWTNTTLRRGLRQAVEADAEFIAIPHGDTVLSYNPGDEGGMRGFYGSRFMEGIVPKNLRKLLEKIDKDAAKPSKVEALDTPSGPRGWKQDGEARFDKSQTGFTLFPLTDKVKRSIMEEGQPLFALSDLAQRHSAWLLDDVGPNDPAPRSVLAFHGTNAEAAFDKLALPSSEFGVHFGTTKQSDYVAKKFGNLSPSYDRARIMPSVLTTRRVLTMDDLVGWFADDIALEIGAAKRYDAEFPGLRNDVKGVTTNEQLRAVFAKHQIDAIRYQNAAEGDGWSYLVWDGAVAKSATSGADIIGKNITPTKIAELAENLRQALDEATTPPPGRLDDPIKDAPKQVERLREDLAEDIAVAMGRPSPAQLAALRSAERAKAVLDRASQMKTFAPGFSLRNLFDPQMKTPGNIGAEPFDIANVVIKSRSIIEIPVKSIKTVQDTVSLDVVKRMIDNPSSEVPSVFKFGGEYFINDGNHRITAAKARGLDNIKAEVIEIEDRSPVAAGSDNAAAQLTHTGGDHPGNAAGAPLNGADRLVSLYQRYVTQGREALDAVLPGTGRMIDEFAQANPEVVARIAEALGAPTGRPQAAQMLEQALPQFTNPRIIDMSKPVLLTPEANARMREIRPAIDETVKMLPPEYRIRVEDSLVWNPDGGDKRLDGLHDGYLKLIYISMDSGDPVRTARHEVVHALRQSGLMKDEEFSALYKFADRLGLRKAYEIDTQYKTLYTEAYSNRGADFVEQLLREETVANMFSDYSLNGRRFGDVAGGGMVDRLIDMIVTFMKQVREIMGGYGFRNVYDVFESIESGAMARRGMGDAQEASRLAMFAGEDDKPLARDLADVQRERDAADLIGACRA